MGSEGVHSQSLLRTMRLPIVALNSSMLSLAAFSAIIIAFPWCMTLLAISAMASLVVVSIVPTCCLARDSNVLHSCTKDSDGSAPMLRLT